MKMRASLLAATVLGATSAAPAWAQNADDTGASSSNDIIVTAQRIEQRLQDVPVSVSVFNQAQLDNNNISNAKDIAQITPGLQLNNRYGSDSTNFSIRGFTQEQRTTATVGVYFADVVAPRGSGATFGGDGAGPGALYDLQNVQVLKGPQGTLFGRNSTGGAVLLVPRKPTDRFEGHFEVTGGDYSLFGVQAVVNLPASESLRFRLGGEHKQRDGYLRNIGKLGDGHYGPKGMGNVDYWTFRFSAVADLSPDIENYTVAYYTKTESNGVVPKLIRAFPNVVSSTIPFGNLSVAQMAREAAFDPWTVQNRLPDHQSTTEQWQVTNTLTWRASDSITLKAIGSYGEFRGTSNLDLFGNYMVDPAIVPGTETNAGQVTGFAFTSATPLTGYTNAQSTMVGELRLAGDHDKLTWQAGVYAEISDPLGFSGVQTATFAACADIANLVCTAKPAFSIGQPNSQLSKTKYRDYAVYGQASYDFTEQLKLTIGARYTWDKTSSFVRSTTTNVQQGIARCANPIGTGIPATTTYPIAQRFDVCSQTLRKDTSKPTWLIGLDYKPVEDLLLYAKWTRGYRQGSVSIFSPDGTQPYEAETVNTYEGGVKASWKGSVPGSFNISGFYNDFKNQQLLLGVSCNTLLAPFPATCPAPSASIVNAGKSYMYGFESELDLRPFEGFHVNVAYGYLNTKLQKFVAPTLPAGSPYNVVTPPAIGGPIPTAQPHKLTISADYTLPLDESIGQITFGGTYIYSSKYRVTNDSCPTNTTVGCFGAALFPGYPLNANGQPSIANPGAGIIPGNHVINLNLSWRNVGGQPIDASVFVTNVTNEVTYLTIQESTSRGWITALLGEPRMWGVRLKYRFGGD